MDQRLQNIIHFVFINSNKWIQYHNFFSKKKENIKDQQINILDKYKNWHNNKQIHKDKRTDLFIPNFVFFFLRPLSTNPCQSVYINKQTQLEVSIYNHSSIPSKLNTNDFFYHTLTDHKKIHDAIK